MGRSSLPLLRAGLVTAAVGLATACGDDGPPGEPYIPSTGSGGSAGTTGGGATDTSGATASTGAGPGTTDPGTTTTMGTTEGSDSTGGGADEVCYPGENLDWTVCLPVVPLDPAPPDYEYPPAYQDNPNYRPPLRVLDLATLDGATKLAPNFRLDEFAQVEKGPYAVVQPHAVEEIQGLRDQVGPIVVNSGYRSPAYNQMIGGATFSRHMYGDAFDMNPKNVPLSTLEDLCSDSGGMLVTYDTHVHCDWRFDPVNEVFFGRESDWMPIFPAPEATAYLVRRGAAYEAPAFGFDEGEPLRRWTALSEDGAVLARATGPTFAPPPGTHTVTVDVGGVVFVTSDD